MCNKFQQIACICLSPVFLNNFSSCSAPHQQYNLPVSSKKPENTYADSKNLKEMVENCILLLTLKR